MISNFLCGFLLLDTLPIAAKKPLPQKLFLAGTEARPTKGVGPEHILNSLLYALCPFLLAAGYSLSNFIAFLALCSIRNSQFEIRNYLSMPHAQ